MNSFTQSLQDSMLIVSLFIAALFIICTVSLALRNYEVRHELKKLKKWRKFSEIEKRQKHEEYDAMRCELSDSKENFTHELNQISTELAEERAFNDTQGSMHVRLMLKYACVQEESEKTKHALIQKETFIAELKKEIEQYQDAVKDLQIEIDQLKAKSERPRNEKGQFIKSKPDRDWTQASKEELLAEAKRRYPVGTNYKGLRYGDMSSSNHDPKFEKSVMFNSECIHVGWDWVYANGKWAQIVS